MQLCSTSCVGLVKVGIVQESWRLLLPGWGTLQEFRFLGVWMIDYSQGEVIELASQFVTGI